MENAKTSPAGNEVRPPNAAEVDQLWTWLEQTGRAEIYDLRRGNWFTGFWIAVFDGYVTGGPGYAGKLLYLVWDGFPDACDVFTFRDGELRHSSSHGDCEQDAMPERARIVVDELVTAACLAQEEIEQWDQIMAGSDDPRTGEALLALDRAIEKAQALTSRSGMNQRLESNEKGTDRC